jgi:spermidine/putrescine transport system substrate-binding protein
MERRQFLLGGVASAVGIGVLGNARFSAAQVDRSKLSKTLRFSSYGGVWQKNLSEAAIKPFEKEYGVKVEEESHGSEAEVLAKIRAAGPGEFDVLTVNESGLYIAVKQGLCEELDLNNIPNYKNLMSKLQKPSYDPGPGVHSVPDVFGSQAIAYNTKYVEKPDSWAVLWNPKYKGRICVRDAAIYRVFTTALYLGQNPNQISDIAKIYDAMRAQRPLVLKYWGGTTEMQNLLANGEAWVGEFVGGRTLVMKDQGLPLEYFIPKTGSRGFVDCVMVAKGSPRKYTAEVFLNFLLESKVAERIAELTKFPHCLDPKKVEIGPEVKRLPDYDPTGTLSTIILTDYDYMEKNQADWERNWTKIKVGG